MSDHPIQPFEIVDGIKRFKRNRIVEYMLERSGGLNHIAGLQHLQGTEEELQSDYDQLLQLIGYSVSGAPLHDVTRARVDAAEEGVPETFSEGFKRGFAECIDRMRDHLEELGGVE